MLKGEHGWGRQAAGMGFISIRDWEPLCDKSCGEYFLSQSLDFILYVRDEQDISVKSQRVNISGFSGHMISVTDMVSVVVT